MKTYTGHCHCNAVRFEVDADFELEPVTRCNCSICTMKGILHLIIEPERFRLLAGHDELVEYRFNTRQAVHKFCRICGIHAFYTPRSHPDKVDVNVWCLDGVDPSSMRVIEFDGAEWEANIEGLREEV